MLSQLSHPTNKTKSKEPSILIYFSIYSLALIFFLNLLGANGFGKAQYEHKAHIAVLAFIGGGSLISITVCEHKKVV